MVGEPILPPHMFVVTLTSQNRHNALKTPKSQNTLTHLLAFHVQREFPRLLQPVQHLHVHNLKLFFLAMVLVRVVWVVSVVICQVHHPACSFIHRIHT